MLSIHSVVQGQVVQFLNSSCFSSIYWEIGREDEGDIFRGGKEKKIQNIKRLSKCAFWIICRLDFYMLYHLPLNAVSFSHIMYFQMSRKEKNKDHGGKQSWQADSMARGLLPCVSFFWLSHSSACGLGFEGIPKDLPWLCAQDWGWLPLWLGHQIAGI